MKPSKIIVGVLSGLALFAATVSAQAAPHRIQVRQGANGGEFYDAVTSQTFTPRGNNYIRLASQPGDDGTTLVVYHSTFDPGRYDATKADWELTRMHQDGYNIVRVFLNHLTIGNPNGSGLSPATLANLTDFLTKAKSHEVYTILTLDALPRDGGYWVANQNPSQIQGNNWLYLADEAVQSKKRYIQDLITGLQGLGAPLDYVFSYNLENEQVYTKNDAPLSFTSGMVTTPTGTFNMAVAADRQQMMDSNMVRWINDVRIAARAVDSTALVSVGFFPPRAVPASDPRLVRTYWAIADASTGGSSADYIDLHSYPSGPSGSTLADDIASFEISSNKKPLVMGEFGAAKAAYPSVTDAAYAVRDWQKASCSQYGFDGWLFWTWDTTEQPEFWNAGDSSGSINGQLAPVVRANPCL